MKSEKARHVYVVTVTGIGPNFVRMSKVFERLDETFTHTMIHTGQHSDDELSTVFFRELTIHTPDCMLSTGQESENHHEQLSYLSAALIELCKEKKLDPAIVLFLGDSYSAPVSAPLFKEGYRIGHIEAGMPSYDRPMPEEVNRVICDDVSDLVFVYTPLYREMLLNKNKSPDQYNHILRYLNELGAKAQKKVVHVRFRRGVRLIEVHGLLEGKPWVTLVGPYGFLDHLDLQYDAFGIVSVSGTSQKECPLLKVPVAVPREFTERPESMDCGDSNLAGKTRNTPTTVDETLEFFAHYSISPDQVAWLGEGKTFQAITGILDQRLSNRRN